MGNENKLQDDESYHRSHALSIAINTFKKQSFDDNLTEFVLDRRTELIISRAKQFYKFLMNINDDEEE